MACTLLNQLKQIVGSVDDGYPVNPCGPSCGPCGSFGPKGPRPICAPPCPFPYLQVCMITPPPCPIPTEPKYVKPLTLPCPGPGEDPPHNTAADLESRVANFYNNYNVDYLTQGMSYGAGKKCFHAAAVALDGQNPRCKYSAPKVHDRTPGCPTGFKPCTMKLYAPRCCNPLDPWRAKIVPCALKLPKKGSTCCS